MLFFINRLCVVDEAHKICSFDFEVSNLDNDWRQNVEREQVGGAIRSGKSENKGREKRNKDGGEK